MIRLRQSIDRALERRWLGILVLLVLVLLLAFVALHTAHDEAHDSLLLTCVAITVLAACVVASTRRVIRVQPPRAMSWRGPPSPFELVSTLRVAPASPPLRL